MYRIAVFASGGGSNFKGLIEKKMSAELPVEFAFLLVNNSKCGAVQKAEEAGIPVIHMSAKTHPSVEEFASTLLKLLVDQKVELIVLAGYMKKIPAKIMQEYQNRILNIHPSLLPAFGGEGYYGMNVHLAVYQRGARFTGMTIHLVNGDYDTGPIIFQDIVEVTQKDTPESIAAKVLEKEHANYWRVVKAFATDQIKQTGEKFWLQTH